MTNTPNQPVETEQSTTEKPTTEKPTDEVVTFSRVTLNYVVIAVAFLVLGVLMGAIGYEQFAGSANTEVLINQAVNRAMAANQEQVEQAVGNAIAAAVGGQGQQQEQQPALNTNDRYDVPDGGNPSIGPADAPITIIEFSDFRCGFCGRFADETLQPILDAYPDEVRVVYRDYVIFGQASYEAALAAECAHDQEAFWPYHLLLFENQQNLNRDQYLAFAEDLDLDLDTFTTCYDEEQHRDEIVADLEFGRSLGIRGTPAFFINGRFVSGAQPFENFAQIIDEELARMAEEGEATS